MKDVIKIKKTERGFTLVEVVVVIAILGVLVAIVVPKLWVSSELARGAKIQADLRTIDSAIVWDTSNGGLGDMAGVNSYFAVWPVPPTGSYRTASAHTAATAPATAYTITSGRGTMGGLTAEEI